MKKFVITLILTSLLFSCAKDGKDGLPGTDGNANIIGTNMVTVTTSSWVSFNTYYYTDFNVWDISANVVNTGAVFVYVENSPGDWLVIPFTFGVLSRSYSFSYQAVRVRFQNTDGTQTANPGTRTFRFVVIPSSNRIIGLDYTDYDKVKEAYNLEN